MIFDNPAAKLGKDVFDNTGIGQDSETLKPLMMVDNTLDLVDSSRKSAKNFGDGKVLAGSSDAANAGSKAFGLMELMFGGGVSSELLKGVGTGFGAADKLKNGGDKLAAHKDLTSTAGSVLKVINKFTGDPYTAAAGGGLTGGNSVVEGIEHYKNGEYVEMLESGADGVSSVAKGMGPGGKGVASVAGAYKAGSKVGTRGNKFAADHNLFGKDEYGHSKTVSDDIALNAESKRDAIKKYYNSDLLGEICGGGELLKGSLEGTVTAGALGIAGYAEDAYTGVKDGYHAAANLFQGLF